jgi:hypothetical protein
MKLVVRKHQGRQLGTLATAVNAMSALLLGSKSDSGTQKNYSGLVLLLLSFFNCIGDCLEIIIALVDRKNLPTVCKETLLHIFGEGTGGVTINRDVCILLSSKYQTMQGLAHGCHRKSADNHQYYVIIT